MADGDAGPGRGPAGAADSTGRDADPPTDLPRTLIGGVGYHDLRDFSVGPAVVRELEERSWPDAVEVRDLSYGPVDVVHRLEWAEPDVERWILVGAVQRGREPGTVTAYRWDGSLPGEDEIQARVAEAVTGVVGLENLLVVTAALEAIPVVTDVIEVEPEIEELGQTLSPAVRRAATAAAGRARELALAPPDEIPLPTAPLGGSTGGNGGGPSRGAGGHRPEAGRPDGTPPADGTGPRDGRTER